MESARGRGLLLSPGGAHVVALAGFPVFQLLRDLLKCSQLRVLSFLIAREREV